MRYLLLALSLNLLVGCGHQLPTNQKPTVVPHTDTTHWTDQVAVQACKSPNIYACRPGLTCQCYTPEEWAGTVVNP